MKPDVTRRIVRMFALVLAAIPLTFGALRALQTGTDYRYLIVALASLATAATAFRFGPPGRLASSALGLVTSTLVAGAVAFGLGASSAAAVWFVALGFSLCETASGALGLFAPRQGA